MQLVVVSCERFSRCAAVNWLQNRSFDFQKPTLIQIFPQSLDCLSTNFEDFSYLGVASQVNITLPIACFRIANLGVADYFSVHDFVFVCRQLQQRLGKHAEVRHLQSYFSSTCSKHLAAGLHEITQVIETDELFHLFFTKLIDPQKELNLSALVFNMGETQFTHVSDRAQSACQNHIHLFG